MIFTVLKFLSLCLLTTRLALTHAQTCSFNGIDLSPLIRGSYYDAVDNLGNRYKLNVCNVVSETACLNNNGIVCQYDANGAYLLTAASWVGNGSTSATWQRRSGQLIANFANGDICPSTGQPRTTQVVFVCSGDGVGNVAITVEASNPCTITVAFPTSAACTVPPVPNSAPPPASPCVYQAANGLTANFSALTMTEFFDHHFWMPGTDYWYNLCADTVSSHGCNMEEGTVVTNDCKVLGRQPATWTAAGGAVNVTYAEGDECSGTERYQLTHQLICNENAGTGYVVTFQPKPDNPCHYVALWQSNIPCALLAPQVNPAPCETCEDTAPLKAGLGFSVGIAAISMIAGGVFYYRLRSAQEMQSFVSDEH